MRIVITGASRGIGATLAALYRARGDEVIATSTKGQAGGGAPSGEFEQAPNGASGLIALDLARGTGMDDLVAAVGDGPVDLLICNAGVYPDKGQDLDTGFGAQDWAYGMAVNAAGPFLTVQALLPALRKAATSSTGAKVAIIASAMGSQARAPGGSYVYRASKAAAVNVARNLAADLAADGIAVAAYHPGWVRTDMGGSGADISVDDSATGLVRQFDALTIASTGDFRDYAGAVIPF